MGYPDGLNMTTRVLKSGGGPGVVAHTCNPSTWEAEAGGLRI
jgi:hypothetical protein